MPPRSTLTVARRLTAPRSVNSNCGQPDASRAAASSACPGTVPRSAARRHSSTSGRQVTSKAPSVRVWASQAARNTATLSGDSATNCPAAAALSRAISVSAIQVLIRASTTRSTASASRSRCSAGTLCLGGTTATSAASVPITNRQLRTTATRPRSVRPDVFHSPTPTSTANAATNPPSTVRRFSKPCMEDFRIVSLRPEYLEQEETERTEALFPPLPPVPILPVAMENVKDQRQALERTEPLQCRRDIHRSP